MAYEVNVAENIDWLEVYPAEAFDCPRDDPHRVQEQLKNQMRYQLKQTLEEALEWERDQHIQAHALVGVELELAASAKAFAAQAQAQLLAQDHGHAGLR